MKATTLQLNTIYIQDCFDFLQSLENKSIDLAIIDPPYNLKIADWDNFKSEQEFLDFSFAWIDLMLQKMKKAGVFISLTHLIIVLYFCIICRARQYSKILLLGIKKTA